MLKNTFIHIPGFGRRKEEHLWINGISDWDDFIDKAHEVYPESTVLKKYIRQSGLALEKSEHGFFSHKLPMKEHWRAYGHFKTAFIDIETTGLSKHRNKITTIGLFDGQDSKVYIRGKNLDKFTEDIKDYSMIVTFNGRCFDIPFIKAKYPEVEFDQLHVDLRFLMYELGYKGGLKKIEKDLGIARDDEIEGVDGYEAVRLWKRYEKGDEEALRTLVAYNLADVENLKILMDYAYEKKIKLLKNFI